jgi:hypothetical protein
MSITQELLRARSDSEDLARLIGDGRWTYRQFFQEAGRRAAFFEDPRNTRRPPHIGILLDNVLDYIVADVRQRELPHLQLSNPGLPDRSAHRWHRVVLSAGASPSRGPRRSRGLPARNRLVVTLGQATRTVVVAA